MSDYASAAERARRAFAAIRKMERVLLRAPDSAALQIKLAARQKLARKMQERLYEAAERQHIELCNYRLIPENTERYALAGVARSFLEYQNVFSQIHDAIENGPKKRAIIGREAAEESLMEFGYTYSGSLGVVLLAPSPRNLFEGRLDRSIEAIYQVLEIESADDVKDIAATLGEAVVKRVHDWSMSNVEAGFSVDVRWNRSDGKQLGKLVELSEMENIVNIIDKTSDEKTDVLTVVGILIGIDLQAGSFHLVVPEGEDFRGQLAPNFPRAGTVEVGSVYRADITATKTILYAVNREEIRYTLAGLGKI